MPAQHRRPQRPEALVRDGEDQPLIGFLRRLLDKPQSVFPFRLAGVSPAPAQAAAAVSGPPAAQSEREVQSALDLSPEKTRGFSLADLAIGPGLGEPGFAEIADLVIPAKVEQLLLFGFGGGWSSISVIVDRVDYTVRRDEEGALSVIASPLYRASSDEPKIDATMAWLQQAFAARLSAPPTPPTLPRRPKTAARELGDAA